MKSNNDWQRYQRWQITVDALGFVFDFSRMHFDETDLQNLSPQIEHAFRAMHALEAGAIANPDEKRRVGHYWLRNPRLAPEAEARAICDNLINIQSFTRKVHSGSIRGSGGIFKNLLLIGIGGSALGPQLISNALQKADADRIEFFFLDNTDPDGIERTLFKLRKNLAQTLILVISKSGTTQETRNGMLETKRAFEMAGLSFAAHAVAITQWGSMLDQSAREEGWLGVFPMWDWVGGRTSIFSAVGLLPAALQGIDVERFLNGAKAMDEITRMPNIKHNPAAMMALLWFLSGNGKGDKNMVILPYKDRLALLSKYLQQLIMESIGKGQNLDGEPISQGISVFGNKGSTDQHAYIQQLREGRNDFFVNFIQVLKDRDEADEKVEAGATTGDYLFGFLIGTQEALTERGRESMTMILPEINPESLGGLIALFERAVGFYASLIGVNAYHQPGVEAGKKAAKDVIDLQSRILKMLISNPQISFSADEIAERLAKEDAPEIILRICEHLSANRPSIVSECASGNRIETRYHWAAE